MIKTKRKAVQSTDLSWKAVSQFERRGLIFGEDEDKTYWAALEITARPEYKSRPLQRPLEVVGHPVPRAGEPVRVQAIRMHGLEMVLVMRSKSPEALIDLVTALSEEDALKLHQMWKADERFHPPVDSSEQGDLDAVVQ